ncbi:ABC transporter permease [Bacillus gobiensis]|uniref:ABC transporter permease n=1 Tax=Bacillus gobiensis TaxID=1441095 RepID=UPI003D1D0979
MSRLKAHSVYQLKVIRLVIDWTVALYLVLPALGVFIYHYIGIYNGSVEIVWLENTGWPWFYASLALLSLFGSMHTFLLEADQLYLLQMKKTVKELKIFAYWYSFAVLFFKWILILLVYAPFLLKYFHYSFYYTALIMGVFFAVNVLTANLKRHISPLYVTLCQLVVFAAVYALMTYLNSYILLALLLVFIYGIIYYRLKITTGAEDFFDDVFQQEQKKLFFTQFFFSLSRDVNLGKPSKKIKRKPILFKNSKRIYQKRTIEYGCKELFFKVLIRNNEYKWNLMQTISLFTALIIIGPQWMKILAAFLFAILFRYFLSIIYDKVMNTSFLSIVDRMSDPFIEAKAKSVAIVYYPALAWCLIILFATAFL